MTTNILPFIGESGVYTLATPFSNNIDTNARYTCQAIRTINDYIAENKDVYKDIYEPVGISQEVYNEDVANNTSIITLQGDTGHWVYVPATYMVKYPDTNGVAYTNKVISFALPATPNDQSTTFMLDNVSSEIIDLIKDRLGLVAVYSVDSVSRVNLISQDLHQLTQDQRNTVKSMDDTMYAKVRRLESHITMLNAKISQLVTLIGN